MSPISSRKNVPPSAVSNRPFCLEQTLLIFDRAGECAAHVTEQRALEQVVVERRAVLNDERLLRARPVIVDRARDQFFAGAALALHEHGGLAAHDLREQLDDLADRRRIADDLVERMRPGRGRNRRRLGALDGCGRRRDEVFDASEVAVVECGCLRREQRCVGAGSDRRCDRGLDIGELAVARAGRVHDARETGGVAHRCGDNRQAGIAALHDRVGVALCAQRGRDLLHLRFARAARMRE
jgi:hypothetical protein